MNIGFSQDSIQNILCRVSSADLYSQRRQRCDCEFVGSHRKIRTQKKREVIKGGRQAPAVSNEC